MTRETKTSPLSKTDQRYWYDRLFKRGDGTDWQVQIQFAGKQDKFPLRTPNKESAAAKAKEIYLSLHSRGWDETLSLFKPWTNQVQRIDSPTVGEFLTAVETFGGINPITFKSYSRKFRRLVASLRKIEGVTSRFHRGEGSAAWRKDVDAVKLATLPAAEINRWKLNFVASKRGDALKQHHAETTAQSILRNSKSLFSPRVLRRLRDAKVEMDLPSPLPFDGVEIGTPPRNRYTSTIDADKLARNANTELAKKEPELFKIFLLSFGVGLRRGEIDRLTWPQFNWSKDQINIVITAHGDAKTESSIAAVDVDPVVMKIFKKFKATATGEFVIESSVKPRPGANWHHYRADCSFKRLSAWLRDKGVDAQKPLHTMRKEFGSRICEQFGIFAASEALRHADIRITRAHYVDKRGRIHLEVGKMLKP
ncbi:MAG: tyrosine-type recombinase/integrase [Verrucomicrobiota bacterium]